jgi:hypothetical protein
MRPLEFIGWLIAFLPVLALLGLLRVSLGIIAAIASACILVAAALWLGAYWQLLPLYLGVLLALAGLLWRQPRTVAARAMLSAGIFCLLVLTAAATYVLPMFSLPKPTGQYAVGTRIFSLTDPVRMETHVPGSTRHREIVVQVWYPASPGKQPLAPYRRHTETTWLSSYMAVLRTHSYKDAPVASGAPFPVLLFNPAWGGQRTQNTYQTEDLASHGFIVAAVDHPYNSGPVAFPDGRVIDIGSGHDISDFHHTTVDQQIAFGNNEVHIQAGDDILTLNYLAAANQDPHSPWYRHLDTENVGAFGHSFGGAASVQTCFEDPRVKAALNEDGWVFGNFFTQGLNKPYMVMYEDDPFNFAALHSSDVQARRDAKLDAIDEADMERSLREFGGYSLMIRGTRHNNFRDRVLYSRLRRLTEAGTISPQRGHQIVEAYTLAFFQQVLLHKPEPLLTEMPSPYKEVQFENWYQKNAPTQ